MEKIVGRSNMSFADIEEQIAKEMQTGIIYKKRGYEKH